MVLLSQKGAKPEIAGTFDDHWVHDIAGSVAAYYGWEPKIAGSVASDRWVPKISDSKSLVSFKN